MIREHQYRAQKMRLEVELAERGPGMKPEARQKYEVLLVKFAEEEKRYNAAKKDIEKDPRKLEKECDVNRDKDPYFDFAEVLPQIAIVMSSISILATSRPMYLLSMALAICGIFLTLDGFTLFIRIPLFHGGH